MHWEHNIFIDLQDGVIPDNELYRISQEIDRSKGTDLAAVLNMSNMFKNILGDTNKNTHPIFNLLLAWRDISGQRSDLATALHDIKLQRVAET